MFVLRLTSDPALHGTQTDDDFTIGVISIATFFLLTATAFAGSLGGVLYLVARRWIPEAVDPVLVPPGIDRLTADSEVRGDRRDRPPCRDQVQDLAPELRWIPAWHAALLDVAGMMIQANRLH